ncbi:undecaprenyldiphospho-muramoylpentapeptide beta-N-acetylglucosaminyltransferase [Alkaliphilus oremlandii]|uniref:UDP-N-acetylglucosamine--N-acetylmuramyl-(pentapeptide) pyrophosphoryl-undecaprenol N-acetylglucosamine transferase n=1 Tax=Alkaliphilus oremlandii (strain OhILAs) TaxID=350688 RepID=MURG_ALKOO|nr:undecaprenyldiphospho-muramoylpentapeptide beta-N-acetylglucosaminyltransferase [Alkaliphilus oremlandii]A8MH36.1 RecName: Full=UDP-N-acetylglucosamine--N-acetylmuramyl-(pentapeptide) pyrophosphoryl-undecaprenol N-acetylglucosamine transferase; AltName: Full=Undecaprenyl-PP-MurNAc-pentapeptide-UDPGlcNAc GlcNAc transferase [Alkaliphilus oremlandii OhILAs]ABW18923.1 UDP-N-acetylglucosamine--N-acetylmuramyl-(pentapeptide) pyrophosphoryl-undecaprenol N-acetylglucosamine transferase [Alkaliphilus o
MRVILSGGGTGGHIYPAISIANKIKEQHPKAEILFIGTENGMESEIVPKAGYPIKYVTVSYLKRKISLHNVKSAAMLLKGIAEARKIIKEFKPDIVIGTGGFVCGPVLYMASKLGIRTMIHEQNVFPGLTNRILDRYVDRIALSFKDAEKYFKHKNKLVVTGNPIRSDFMEVTEVEASARYKTDSDLPLVLVVGGSGGALKINRAVVEILNQYQPNKYRLLLVTGKRLYKSTLESINAESLQSKHKVFAYVNDMPHALKACDLIVCSAGAITIAEVTAVGKASILIPKAHTAENHQEYNANAMGNKGAAVVIREDELSGEILNKKIQDIIGNIQVVKKMEAASYKEGIRDAADRIYSEMQALLERK